MKKEGGRKNGKNPYIGKIRNLHRYVKFTPEGDYPRYNIHIRINHILTALTFTIAIWTGLPLYFHNTDWARAVNSLTGGIDVTRIIHRVNAVIFILNALYHLAVVAAGIVSQVLKGEFEIRRTMIPLPKDFRDFFGDMLYFAGLRDSRPRMEKFMYKQKFHYAAIIWGNFWIIVSGLCLWFPVHMVRYLPFPDVSFNILRLLHADESILATLVIVFWHWFNVHIAPGRFPMQWVWLTGRISRDHQIEEHFLEYERQVEEGIADVEEEILIKGEGSDD